MGTAGAAAHPEPPNGGVGDSMISVLLVEDHALVAHTITRALASVEGIHVEGWATSISEALTLLPGISPSVIVLDYHLPDGDAVTGMGKIHADQTDPIPVVVMTGDLSPAVLSRCLEAGAAGFVRKDGDFAQLVRAVRGAASGEAAVLDGQALRDLARLHQARRQLPELTTREEEVLMCLARGHDAAAIADELSLSIHTVRNYISALLEKLDVSSQLQAVSKAMRLGMITPEDLR